MKRFASLLLLALTVIFGASPPASGQTVSGDALFKSKYEWQTLEFRNTSAATVARNPLWGAAKGASGFADSMLFRKGAVSQTSYDTTRAYNPVTEWPFQPSAFKSSATGGDTLMVPWLILRIKQDTTSFVSTLGAVPTALDSFRVGAQISVDGGANWFAASGTPTRLFDPVYFTSGEDGIQMPDIPGAELSPGADFAYVVLGCTPSSAVGGGPPIINKTLCTCGALVRFIIGCDGTGQFVLQAAQLDNN